MIGRIICWLVRQFGGSHRWRRLRKREQQHSVGAIDLNGNPTGALRICSRCGLQRAVAVRIIEKDKA